MSKLVIGTRGSKLALWQAYYLQGKLKEQGVESELRIIKTRGDQIQHLSFDKIEGKGFFTQELEEALLDGSVDVAVHSMKDLPTRQSEGLAITAVSYREDPADWLLIRPDAVEEGRPLRLAEGCRVGTSSARRKAQLKDLRPDLQLQDLRGNVPTRVDKLRRGEADAILLAAAGLRRLELELDDLLVQRLHPREFVPAPAQGVLAYQVKKDNTAVRRILNKIHHTDVSAVTNVERKVLKLMEGGCHMPLGVFCERDANGHFHVWAAHADAWQGPLQRIRLSSSTSHGLAEQVAGALKKKNQTD